MLTVYRLALQDPLNFNEQMGDPITNQGGAPVPALRAALRHAVGLSTISGAGGETVESRFRLRRQLRGLFNNTPMKLQGLFLAWDADPENSGWYMPDMGQVTDLEGIKGIGPATGLYEFQNFVWIKAGSTRTHRRAVGVLLKDVRQGTWPRDHRRAIYSTDFSGLTPLALTYLPPGATDLLSTGSVASPTAFSQPAGNDGGQGLVLQGAIDLARVSYEQPEASRNLGQVVLYDRRGERTGPVGTGAAWEEAYGPDHALSWVEGGVIDAPVIENARCRVRYEPSNTPGFSVDVWTGTAWEQQGKLNVLRVGSLCNELLSASIVEYAENRAVIQAVMKPSAVAGGRTEVIITLQRGWSGPKVEAYPAPETNGEKSAAGILYTVVAADTDDTIVKFDTSSAIEATAKGTGHTGNFAGGTLGAGTFNNDNDLTIGRWKGTAEALPYGVNIAVFQTSASLSIGNGSTAYGAGRNQAEIVGAANTGWLGIQLGYYAQQAEQGKEAENFSTKTGFTETADAAAANGKAMTTTQTADTNALKQTTWPNGDKGTYRVFARVKTSASTLNIYCKTSLSTGATKTTTSAGYVWVDLGDIKTNNGVMEIHCWALAAATCSVDRIEAFLVEDRETASAGVYEGARDLGQRSLYDSRATPTLVTRTI